MSDTPCIFCNIITKKSPSYIVYEDAMCVGFLDIAPLSRGHSLIVPKVHYQDIFDFEQRCSESIVRGIQKVGAAIKKTFGAEGIQVIQNNGIPAGQVIFHVHWHIIPRYVDDGLLQWQGKMNPQGEGLQEIAEAISNNL